MCLYPCCRRKTTWATNTKLDTQLHGRTLACIDPDVKRSRLRGYLCTAATGMQVHMTASVSCSDYYICTLQTHWCQDSWCWGILTIYCSVWRDRISGDCACGSCQCQKSHSINAAFNFQIYFNATTVLMAWKLQVSTICVVPEAKMHSLYLWVSEDQLWVYWAHSMGP